MSVPRYLAVAQRQIEKTFNTTATVTRLVSTPDNTGGQSTSYVTVGTFPCQFYRQGTTPRERENAVQVQVSVLWIFVFAYGTELMNTDIITCNGRTFEVVSAATGSMEVAARVLAMEIT